MSSQKNVPDARIELGTTLTRPVLYHLIFFWQGLSFLKIFLVSYDILGPIVVRLSHVSRGNISLLKRDMLSNHTVLVTLKTQIWSSMYKPRISLKV